MLIEADDPHYRQRGFSNLGYDVGLGEVGAEIEKRVPHDDQAHFLTGKVNGLIGAYALGDAWTLLQKEPLASRDDINLHFLLFTLAERFADQKDAQNATAVAARIDVSYDSTRHELLLKTIEEL